MSWRDDATAVHLKKRGVTDVRVVGCPSILLDAQALPLPEADPVAQGAVLISVRHPKLMSVPYSLHAKVRADVRRLIELARKRGHENIKLLCHDPADLSFAAEFRDVPMLYTEGVARFLGWLRDSLINLSFRLHSFVPCVSLGVPALHFSYDQSALNLIQTLGLSAWDIDFANTPDIIPHVSRYWNSLAPGATRDSSFAPRWADLKATMTHEVAAFAARVDKHALSCKF